MRNEPTNPGTPSTLAMLHEAKAALHEAKAVLAKTVELLEEVEKAVRLVDALRSQVGDHEERLSLVEQHLGLDRHRDTMPAPSVTPGSMGGE